MKEDYKMKFEVLDKIEKLKEERIRLQLLLEKKQEDLKKLEAKININENNDNIHSLGDYIKDAYSAYYSLAAKQSLSDSALIRKLLSEGIKAKKNEMV